MERAFNRLIGGRKPKVRNPFPVETVGVRYKSEVCDVVHYADGRVETIDHGHNVMLNSFLPLITDLLVNGGSRQLKYWAVGKGESTWDTEPSPEIVTVVINNGCTQNGNVTLTLGGVAYSVALTTNDSAETVATKLSAISFNSSAVTWNVERYGATVTFTAQKDGNITGASSYNPNNTGALGSVSVTDGKSEMLRPTPLPTQNGLVNEVYRKKIENNANYPNDGIHFLDSNGDISTAPTNIIEIQLTFGDDEGLENGEETPWREFSIVGGSDATATLKTGYYMNVKNHACLVKTNTMTVERKIKFTFTNADS